MCGLLCFAQIVYNPVYDRTAFEVFHPHVDKVEIKKDSTKVYCSIKFQENNTYGIPKMFFLEDLGSNKKYQIIKCIGLPFLPHEQIFNAGDTYQFVFCFPYIENLQQFNLKVDSSEEKIFNVYGVDITNSFSNLYEEGEYNRFKNMSDFYKSSGNIDKFLEFEKKELSAAQYVFGKKSLAAAFCYQVLASYYHETGDYKKAIELGLQALECDSIHFGVDNPVYAIMLTNLSFYYDDAKMETEYLQCAEKCIKIRKNLGEEEQYLNELYNISLSLPKIYDTLNVKDGILKRIAVVEKELKGLPDFIDVNSLSLVKVYKKLAVQYGFIRDYDNAINYCNKAITILDYNKKGNSEESAKLLGIKCDFQEKHGYRNEAIVSGEKAKELFDSLEIKSSEYAELLGNLAWLYGLDYNYERSIQLQVAASNIYEEKEDWLSMASAFQSVCYYYSATERLDDAELYIKKAIKTLNEHDVAEQYIFREIESTGNALINNPSHLSTIKIRINYEKANLYQTLASIYQKQGNFVDAINAELEHGKILKNMNDKESYAIHLMNISCYYRDNNQINDAIACAEQCVKLCSDGSKLIQAESKLNLAISLFISGDTIRAIQNAEECISAAKLFSDSYFMNCALTVLSNMYRKCHSYDKAEKTLSESLNYLKCYISKEIIGMTTEQKQRLWNLYEHEFLLYRKIIESSVRNASLLSKLYDYVLFSKNLLLDTEIQQDVDGSERIKITWKDIQQNLSEDDIAIEFISTVEDVGVYHTYHALIVDKKQPCPQMVTLFNEKDLEEKKKKDTRNIDDIVGELIWNPIINLYPNAKNIYFSPDCFLHMLPIEYYGSDGIKNMSEHYNMYRLSSTKEIVKKLSKPQFNSAVLFGGLDYNSLKEFSSKDNLGEDKSKWRNIAERGGFDPLYNTLIETQEIEDIFAKHNIPITLYTGENGTEESFRNLSGRNNGIIHLATHGMYVLPDEIEAKREGHNFNFLESLVNEKDPVKEDIALTHSFLVMAGGNRLVARENVLDKSKDGILTSMEISQLDLRGLDLVVLSACETAQGDIYSDGVYGLQRGFKKAGANTILMSLDKVDDEATRILMVEFYRNLANGKTKQESLKGAQRYLRKVENGKYDDPKYWASFVLLDGLN